MAVAYGSGSSTTYASRTNTTVTAPSGISNGDLLIAQIITAVAGTPADPTPPSGWTQIGADGTQGDGGFNIRICIWYKIANGESGNYTWTHAANSSQGQIHRYTGVDQTNPINVSSSRHELVANTTRTADGVTTTVANCMLCYIGWDWADNTTNETPPTGFTERQDATLNYWADALQASAGASGNKTNTCNSASNSPRGAHLVALAPATASAYTLTADTAAYSVSGTAADIERGFKLAADTAAYAVTGTDATLRRTARIAADTAAYSIAGTAAGILAARKLDAATAAYAITGADATLSRIWKVIADSGSYSLSGTDAVLQRTGLLIADGGSYALAGTDAGIRKSIPLAAEGTSYSVSGTAATLLKGSEVAADGGAYSLSGTDASFLRTYVLPAASASYSLSGTAAATLHGFEIVASSETYAINGADVTFLRSYVIPAAPASYTVGGSEADLLYSASPPAESSGSVLPYRRRRRT